MSKKEPNPLFIGISNANDIRRGVLECSKDTLESLKSYESFKKVRNEKIKLINSFRGEMKEITKLISSLKSALPKVKEMESAPRIRKEAATYTPPSSEVDRLERELNKIEDKLNSLG